MRAKRQLFPAALLLLSGILTGTVMWADEVPLKVMTFNIRYGTAMDGENAWPKRCALLADTIKKYDPDILGTQECLEFQAEFLEKELKGFRQLGIGREKDGAGEMTAIFYRNSLLAPVEYGTFWLSEEPGVPGSVSWDSSLTRSVTRVKFLHRQTGRLFWYFNTHFDHRGEEARQQSARLLVEKFAALPAQAPIILTGDFNADAETSRPWEILTTAGMKDAWLEADTKSGPGTTWCNFKAPEPGKRIDWILFQGPVQAKKCIIAEDRDNGHYPSDHLPVLGDLIIK